MSEIRIHIPNDAPEEIAAITTNMAASYFTETRKPGYDNIGNNDVHHWHFFTESEAIELQDEEGYAPIRPNATPFGVLAELNYEFVTQIYHLMDNTYLSDQGLAFTEKGYYIPSHTE